MSKTEEYKTITKDTKYIEEDEIVSKYSKYDLEREKNGKTGFCVSQIEHCPHIDDHLKTIKDIKDKFSQTCKNCKGDENWVCLTCGDVLCSRYQNGHFQKHFESTKHAIGISLQDLSIWCYKCDDYINNNHQELKKIRKTFEETKFPPDDPYVNEKIQKVIENIIN